MEKYLWKIFSQEDNDGAQNYFHEETSMVLAVTFTIHVNLHVLRAELNAEI